MADLTDTQVGAALKKLGHYRVTRAQRVAKEGVPDGISGALLLALGIRETRDLGNVEGGAKFENGRWVAETDPMKLDVGFFQISRRWHFEDLRRMPGVKAGTWGPVILNANAGQGGYCPRFEDSLQFTLLEMHEAQAYAEDNDIPSNDLARFAVAAHNGGRGGALKGAWEGDMDKYTTHGDYSAWVLRHRTLVNRWLGQHDRWKV